MLRLDAGTQAFSAGIVSLAAALIIAAYGASRPQDKHWGAFALSSAFYGAAALPIAFIGSLPVALIDWSIAPLTMLSALAFHAGACHLAGRQPPHMGYLAILLAVSVGQSLSLAASDSLNGRIAVISLARLPVFVHAAMITHATSRDHRADGIRWLRLVGMGWAALLALRGLDALIVESPIRDLVGMGGVQAFFFLATGLANILTAVALLRMDTDSVASRLESEAAHNLIRSESDLRAILDNMTDIFFRTDSEGRLLMLSRSVETILGYPAAELLGTKTVDYYMDAADRTVLLGKMEADGGTVTDHEFQIRHKDGYPVWVSVSSHILRDPDGRPAGNEGIMRLIEDRKRAEMKILDSQSLIRAMLDASADAIMLIQADGTVLAVNDVTAGRFGRTTAELADTCLWDLFPPEVAAARRRASQEVLDSGVPLHTLDRRGDHFLDNSIYPVTGPDGKSDRLAVYSRDITVQKLAEGKIADYIAEVERSNAELEQFAYVASHDLREPLRMISSYLSLLERRYADRLDSDGAEFLAFARDGAQRMDRLVLDLLEFSRIGRRGAAIVAMPALSAINTAIRHLEPTITECGARITVEQTEPLPMIMGDADQITRLFQNLIGNALKYRADDHPPEIHISYGRVGDAWEFHVADNGIGIEEIYFERIFRIFQRLHTRDRYEGTGIGLAICKKIVERHDGRIWVESTPRLGSTFSFTLKAAP